ncbi:Nuclear receptor-binding [Portunus trituberculatus]|uniref:Nuclear receptor-binding n=1 Tax=Portunus trituberculatus TaxID=210409 RepID=A0A5B7DXK2_PORTR|nr:Nuclear receptor-binding [Portunus trituberculatus]
MTGSKNGGNETEAKSPRESGEDSEDESEILEESPCGRWSKRRQEDYVWRCLVSREVSCVGRQWAWLRAFHSRVPVVLRGGGMWGSLGQCVYGLGGCNGQGCVEASHWSRLIGQVTRVAVMVVVVVMRRAGIMRYRSCSTDIISMCANSPSAGATTEHLGVSISCTSQQQQSSQQQDTSGCLSGAQQIPHRASTRYQAVFFTVFVQASASHGLRSTPYRPPSVHIPNLQDVCVVRVCRGECPKVAVVLETEMGGRGVDYSVAGVCLGVVRGIGLALPTWRGVIGNAAVEGGRPWGET